MREFIYESPKNEKRRSAPIRESNTAARRFLEQRGWRVVETRDVEDTDDEDMMFLPVIEPEAVDPFADFRAALKDEQWAALTGAGYGTPEAIRAAPDDSLRDIEGIGPAALRNLRAALATPTEPPEE